MLMLCVVLAAAPVKNAGPFEGVLHYSLKMPGGSGALNISVGKGGIRSEIALDFNGKKSTQVMVVTSDEPKTTYVYDESKKVFKAGKPNYPAPSKISVELLPDENVAGIKCRRVKLVSGDTVSEYFTSAAVFQDKQKDRWMAVVQRLAPEIEDALKSAGAFGLVVKMVTSGKAPNQAVVSTVLELETMQRTKIDQRLFRVR
jgi:hypothetical protein